LLKEVIVIPFFFENIFTVYTSVVNVEVIARGKRFGVHTVIFNVETLTAATGPVSGY